MTGNDPKSDFQDNACGHDRDDGRKGYHSNRLDELILMQPKLRRLINVNAYAKNFSEKFSKIKVLRGQTSESKTFDLCWL